MAGIVAQTSQYICVECNANFMDRFSLRAHTAMHIEVETHHIEEAEMETQRETPSTSSSFVEVDSHLERDHETSYKCQICRQTFTSSVNAARHVLHVHDGMNIPHCILCRISFRGRDSIYIRSHLRAHLMWKLECAVCNKIGFPQASDLLKHMESHINDKSTECPVCHTDTLSNFYKFRNHFANHIKGPQYCPICKKVLAKAIWLKEHMKTHNTKCSECNQIFTSPTKFKNHLKEGHKPKNYCYICKHTCHSESLENHMKKHKYAVGKRFKCEKCHEMFDTQPELRHHVQHLHIKTSECPMCHQFFTRLSQHMPSCTKGKTISDSESVSGLLHICSICGVKYASGILLRTHMEEDHLIDCDICNEKLRGATELANHRETHKEYEIETRSHPPACCVCGEESETDEGLEIHRQEMHKNLCMTCHHLCIVEEPEIKPKGRGKGRGKGSGKGPGEGPGEEPKNEVINHLIFHSALFSCVTCGKTFQDGASRREHIETDHTFYCDKCSIAFDGRSGIERHMTSCHLFFCDTCYCVTTNECELVKHNRRHEDREPWVRGILPNVAFPARCNKCPNMLFNHYSEVEEHVKERHMYFCNICYYVATNESDLVQHKSTHFAAPAVRVPNQ